MKCQPVGGVPCRGREWTLASRFTGRGLVGFRNYRGVCSDDAGTGREFLVIQAFVVKNRAEQISRQVASRSNAAEQVVVKVQETSPPVA